MKNIFKISILFFVLITLGSCTNDIDPVVSTGGLELRKDAGIVSPAVLTPADDANTYIGLNWDEANNGVPTQSKYEVIISDHDNDSDFSEAVVFSGVGTENTVRTSSFTVLQFNELLNRLPSFSCDVMNIDIRVKSTLGTSTNALIQYSNPITVAVKAYSKLPAIISFATDASSATTAQKVKSSDFVTFSDYEGFMYLEPGNYRFYQPNSCGEFNASTAVYGISGGNAGTVVLDGTNSYNVATAGHYFVKVNMINNTYSIVPFNAPTASFGVFGNATGVFGFANTKVMNYEIATKKWKITIELINGKKFGFKTGNGATPAAILAGSGTGSEILSPLTVTTTVDNTGTIKAPGDFVNDTTKTKYDVEVDVSNPRAYTYKLTVNNT